jgi:hypothetical protein
MHHPILVLLGVFFLARLFMRRARWRRLGYCYGYGCGRLRGRRGPIDLGAPDDDDDSPGARFERRAARWTQRWERGQRIVTPPPAPPVVDVAGALELNPRQRTLFDDVVAKAKGSLPAATLAEVLAAVGREPFQRDKVEDIVGPGDLADDLLQLHHSLTAEQRARLREVTSA